MNLDKKSTGKRIKSPKKGRIDSKVNFPRTGTHPRSLVNFSAAPDHTQR